MAKPIIWLKDLYQFCIDKQVNTFKATAKEDSIIVSIPATYSAKKYFDDESDDRFMSLQLKACHTLENLNGSGISEESMTQYMDTFHNCPILGSVKEIENPDGTKTYDFNGHDMEVIDDPFNKGEQRVHYIERVIGVVPSDSVLSLEKDEKSDKKFLYADGLIYVEHGNLAADILKQREEVACSVEIAVDEMSFNAKDKIMNIEAFRFLGCMLLGADVKEGMQGSRAYTNYAAKEQGYEQQLIELLGKVNTALSDFNNTNLSKGGKSEEMNKFEELLEQYGKTADDITFDYDGLTDEELETKFAEEFGSTGEDPVDEPNDDFSKSKKKRCTIDDDTKNMSLIYEISHDDIRYGLYSLLSSFENTDNEWYFISNVYDTYFIYENWDGTKTFKQSYAKDGDNVSFDGERIALFKELLTEDEKNQLEEMRADYSALKEFKNQYEINEAKAMKEEILSDEAYTKLSEFEDFKTLVKEADTYSVEEIQNKADLILAKYVKSIGHFEIKDPTKRKAGKKVLTGTQEPDTAQKPYGGMFEEFLKK